MKSQGTDRFARLFAGTGEAAVFIKAITPDPIQQSVRAPVIEHERAHAADNSDEGLQARAIGHGDDERVGYYLQHADDGREQPFHQPDEDIDHRVLSFPICCLI